MNWPLFFLRPWWLLCIPAAGLLLWFWHRSTDVRRQWTDVIAPHLLDHLLVGGKAGWRWRPIHMMTASVGLAGIVAAGPTWEQEPPPFTEDKAPMVVAIDLSRTMDAVDIPPTRLERTKEKVRDLAALRSGSRTGLVVYAGSAHLVLPPTEDPGLLEIFLAALDTSLMPVSGRNASGALEIADRLLKRESAAGTVVFMADGFDGNQISLFADYQRQPSHQVLAIAVGTAEGGPVRSKNGRVELDRHGVPIQARFDRTIFTRLSDEARVPVAGMTLDDVDVEWIQRKALHHLQVVNERTAEVRWKEFGYYGSWLLVPLAASWFRKGWTVRWIVVLLSILVELGSPDHSSAQQSIKDKSQAPITKELTNHKPTNTNAEIEATISHGAGHPVQPPGLRFIAWSAKLLSEVFLTPDQQGRWHFERGDYAEAATRFHDPTWKGLALYKAGDYGAALEQFARVNTPEAFFLMGNCSARLKEYPAAVGAYDHALTLRNGFAEARSNRKLVAGLIPKKPHEDQEGEADPNLDPDEIKFDKKGKRGKAGAVPQLKVKPAQMAELWMRNLQVSPAEFLREKFRMQAEDAKRASTGAR